MKPDIDIDIDIDIVRATDPEILERPADPIQQLVVFMVLILVIVVVIVVVTLVL